MAIILDQAGKKKQNDPAAATQPLAAPSGGATGQPAAPTGTAAPKQAGSGGFTDLSKYLANNDVSGLAKGAADKAAGGSVQTTFAPTEAAPTVQSTVDLTNSEDVDRASNALSSTYDTNKAKNDIDSQAAGAQVRAATAASNTAALASGNQGALRSALAGDNARRGIANLSAFGLSRDANAQNTFQNAAKTAQTNVGAVQQGIGAAKQGIDKTATDFADQQKALRNYIGTQATALSGEALNRAKAANVATQEVAPRAFNWRDPNSVAEFKAQLGPSGEYLAPEAIKGLMQSWDQGFGQDYYAAGEKAGVGSLDDVGQIKLAALNKLGQGFDPTAIRVGTDRQATYDNDRARADLQKYLKYQAESRAGDPGHVILPGTTPNTNRGVSMIPADLGERNQMNDAPPPTEKKSTGGGGSGRVSTKRKLQ
jgi:hypothetical protein